MCSLVLEMSRYKKIIRLDEIDDIWSSIDPADSDHEALESEGEAGDELEPQRSDDDEENLHSPKLSLGISPPPPLFQGLTGTPSLQPSPLARRRLSLPEPTAAAPPSVSTQAVCPSAPAAIPVPVQQYPTKLKYRFRKRCFETMDLPFENGQSPEEAPGKTDIEYFFDFISADFFCTLATETNNYALKEKNIELKTSASELKQFFGILLMMGVVKMPRLEIYWANDTRYSPVADCMSHNRFRLLKRCLHFADNEYMPKPGEAGYDRLYKVRPILHELKKNMEKLPEPQLNSIDEQMIPFKGRNSLKVYIKNKPHKWGYKVFTRATTGGMMKDFILYVGAGTYLLRLWPWNIRKHCNRSLSKFAQA